MPDKHTRDSLLVSLDEPGSKKGKALEFLLSLVGIRDSLQNRSPWRSFRILIIPCWYKGFLGILFSREVKRILRFDPLLGLKTYKGVALPVNLNRRHSLLATPKENAG